MLIKDLFEDKQHNLIGLRINGRLVSKDTCNQHWDGNFNCSNFDLTSLEGAPKEVHGDFWCFSNYLTSLKGAPTKITSGVFNCAGNKLISLEYAPREVRGSFLCYNNNKLTTLKDVHKLFDWVSGEFDCENNPIKSHVLGLLLIPGVRCIIGRDEWIDIVNRHLGKGRKGLIDCQNELIEARLEEYAQL